MAPLVDVELSAGYANQPDVLRRFQFQIRAGEIAGLAGQSGSGKSTLALSLMRLLDPRSARLQGHILFEGRDLLKASEKELRAIRGKEISLVLQSPIASLNPSLRLRTQLKEAWCVHEPRRAELWERSVAEALEAVCLPTNKEFLNRYASELSVGMAQRLLIAMAILHRPKLLIADEATSALDLITQSEILRLLASLREEFGMSILFITHDLAAAGVLCDSLGILHEGELIERGPTRDVFDHPKHPYTARLLNALPQRESTSVLQWRDGLQTAG